MVSIPISLHYHKSYLQIAWRAKEMKKVCKTILCITLLFTITGCGNQKEESEKDKPKLHGEIKELLNKNGWKSMCDDSECYIINDDNDLVKDFDDKATEDIAIKIYTTTSLTKDELTKHLAWMNEKREENMLMSDEIIDKDRLAKIFPEKITSKNTDQSKDDKETTSNNDQTASNSNSSKKSDASKQTSDKQDSSKSHTDSNSSSKPNSNNTSSSLTTEQRNALGSASNYLNYMPFSYSGLIQQLEFEGYSNEVATYAADHCGADWNQQALKSGKNYLNSGQGFSQSGLYNQLEFEGYTSDQASYGVNHCGANWNDEAVKSAKNYTHFSDFSRQGLIDQLMFEGYTQAQAEYGVTAVGY